MPEPQTSLTELRSVAVDQDPDELPHTELATVLEREHRPPVWRARLFWGLVVALGLAIVVLAVVNPTPVPMIFVAPTTIHYEAQSLDELRAMHAASPCDAALKEDLHRRLVLEGHADEATELNHRFAVDCALDSPP